MSESASPMPLSPAAIRPESPVVLAAKLLVRAGVALLVLCLCCWLLPVTAAGRMATLLATIVSVLVVLTGAAALRISRRRAARTH